MKYLAAFAPFHNEALNLPEWLAHHLNMGVEHFLLMEHQSSVGGATLEVLKAYIENQGRPNPP